MTAHAVRVEEAARVANSGVGRAGVWSAEAMATEVTGVDGGEDTDQAEVEWKERCTLACSGHYSS